MALTFTLCTILGLIIGDILCFAIYHLCNFFSEEDTQKARNSLVKDYIGNMMYNLQNNRTRFITYYLSIDIITIALTILMVVLYGVTIKAFAGMLFCYCLIVLTYVDAKTQMLPDIITKPLIAFGLLQAYFGLYTDFKSACIGAFAGYWSLWLINTIFRLIRHKEGMGYGDFKLFAAIGAWIGFAQLPFVIFFSSVLGIFVAVFLARLPENKLSSPSPFGPSLAITGLISMIWGQQIINWYLGLYI